MNHPCPYCGGKGRTRAPAEVQWAVHQLSRATVEHQMLRALAERYDQWVETTTLMFLLYSNDYEPHPKVLATMAHRLRSKLKPFGLTLRGTNTHPSAYRLSLVETQGSPQDAVDVIRLPDARQWLRAHSRATPAVRRA